MMQGSNELRYSREQSLVKIDLIALVACSAFLLIGIYRQVLELIIRSDIGIGLTDEAYGILHTIDRGMYGQTSSTPLFADVTSILMDIANYDVKIYRFWGYGLLLGVSLLLCYIIVSPSNSLQDKPLVIWKCLTSVLVVLLLPSSFRYLLVTPGYQWIVLLVSILIVITLSQLTKEANRKNRTILIFSALLVFVIELARFTSGFASCVLVGLYILKKTDFKNFIAFNLGVLGSNVIYVGLNLEAFVASLDRLLKIRAVDPAGANLIHEVQDVANSTLLVCALILIPVLIMNSELGFKQVTSQKNHALLKLIKWSCLSLVVFYLILNLKYFPHLVPLLPLVGVGVLYSRLHSKINYLLLSLSLLPVVSQFGSNIQSSYLIMPIIASGFLFLFLDPGFAQKKQVRESKCKKALTPICVLSLTLSLLTYQIFFSYTSYENGYGSQSMERDSRSGLLYSVEKMKSIKALRTQISQHQSMRGSRVLDLSNWHPGIIYYVGGRQLPFSTADKVFNKTLAQQLEQTLSQSERKGNLPLIVETSTVKPSLRCQKLDDYKLDIKLQRDLRILNFNPYVKEVGIYLSNKEDLTLFPKNVAFMIPCEP